MKFVDELKIEVHSGKGGDGVVAFRREKYVPFGGPAGGDGGKGGNVVMVASPDVNTLYELSFQRLRRAKDGENGMTKDKTGGAGHDCEVTVPVGTLIYDQDSDQLLADLSEPGLRFVVARGGRGGYGNARFATSVCRAPRIAEKGEPGEHRKLRLELKLLADVGIVGLPNAGKSTLLRIISNAKPKVADYPFTTLVPMLGIVKLEDAPSFCVADIPGLIENAHTGAGLGTFFLKHIERTRVLLILIDLSTVSSDALLEPLDILLQELQEFEPKIIQKPIIVGGNKLDLPQALDLWPQFKTAVEERGFTVVPLSGATSRGKRELLEHLSRIIATIPANTRHALDAGPPEKLYTYLAPFEIENVSPNTWRAVGREIENLVKMTDFTNDQSIAHFKKKLKKIGFPDELIRSGGAGEDTVIIGDMEFIFREFFI